MTDELFAAHRTVPARALFLGERIDMRALETTHRLAVAPLVVPAGSSGCAAVFRYGVVVFFDLNSREQDAFLEHFASFVVAPFGKPETEEVELLLSESGKEGVEKAGILLTDFQLEKMQLVAHILAKSAVLSHYELAVNDIFDRIEPLAASLQRTGRGGFKGRELLRHIGSTLLIHHRMVGRVEVPEKPDLLWERPDLERLYQRLADEYEIPERHGALGRKLELISGTAETLVELLRHRTMLRVEWYIVVLIAVEIGLMLAGSH